MSLTYGFYDSYNGDRVYNAEQFSSFLDGIIYDGIYSSVGNKFEVKASGGMGITVDTGRAWFDHTWTLNTSKYNLTVSAADTVYARIDAVVIEVNKADRKNYLKIVKGTAESSPSRPTLSNTSNKIQHALAYIRVPKNADSISDSNITNVVETETPLVSALSLAGIPSGGKIGQVLAKKSSESGAIGWYDSDKLPFDKWYLASGITESNVMGAFKFIGRASESEALKSVNSTSRSLTKMNSGSNRITWNSSSGFTLQPWAGLHNSTIWNNDPVSVIIKFSNATSGSPVLLSEINNGRVLYARTPYTTESYNYLNSNTLGFNYAFNTGVYNQRKVSQVKETTGIVGCTFTSSGGTLFNNKENVSVTNIENQSSIYPSSSNGYLIGMRNNENASGSGAASHWTWGSVTVEYALFLNTSITLSQFTEICNYITSDAG